MSKIYTTGFLTPMLDKRVLANLLKKNCSESTNIEKISDYK